MEISTNSSIYTLITSLPTTSSNTKSVNDLTSTTDNSFTVSQNPNVKTQASDYTYDEYKKLSAKEINKIFPWDKMPHENEKAHKLQLLATLSPDETLDQVLFDKAKNADFNDISTRNFFDRTLASAELEKVLISSYEYFTSKEGIEDFKKGYIKSILELPEDKRKAYVKEEGFSSVDDYIYFIKNGTVTMSPLEKEIDGIVDAKMYFQFYQTSEDYFKEYGKDLSDYSRKYLPGEFALYEQVKSEYDRRVSQNDTMLNQLTYNSKPNPLEINI